jgi:hypothetical protein
MNGHSRFLFLAQAVAQLRRSAQLTLGFCSITLSATVFAADATTTHAPPLSEKNLIYIVKPNDTLSQLTRLYLQSASDAEIIQTLNQIDNPNRLPIGFELQLPRHLLQYKRAIARVTSANCELNSTSNDRPKLIPVDSTVTEGNTVDVPAGCAVDLRLSDGTLIRLPSGASVIITRLRHNALEKSPEVLFDLTKGRIDLNVQKPRSKDTPFEVRTPISVMGVRGTEFRVNVTPDHTARLEVLGGQVQMQGKADHQARALNAGQGVIINTTGRAGQIKTLPSRPALLQSIADTKSNQIKLEFASAPDVEQFALKTSLMANQIHEQTDRLVDASHQLEHTGQNAIYLKIAGVTDTGLTGFEQSFAICVPEYKTGSQKCNLSFESSYLNDYPFTIRLVRIDQGGETELLNKKSLQTRSGKFQLKGLKSGQYKWTLSYSKNLANGKKYLVEQSDEFNLITISQHAPL